MNRFLTGIIWVIILTACSAENVPTDITQNDSVESRYMTISVMDTNTSTRAGIDYEDGVEDENTVTLISFFFFKENGDPALVIENNGNCINCTAGEFKENDNNTDKNVSKTITATIQLKGSNIKDNLYSVAAVLNWHDFKKDPKNLSLSQLKEECGNYAAYLTYSNVPTPYNKDTEIPSIIMSSSSYSDNSGTDKFTVETAGHIADSEKEAVTNPVVIHVERLVAKVRLSTDFKDGPDKMTNVTCGEKNGCTAIALKDKEGNYMKAKTTEESEEKQIYVIFENWNLHNTAQKSWLIKRIDGKWELDGWEESMKNWNAPEKFRSYWAQNHPDVIDNLKHFSYEDAKGELDKDWFYCLENAADGKNGEKVVYDPDNDVTNRTQIFVKGRLVTLEGTVATPLQLAEWGAKRYTVDGAKTTMLSQVNKSILIRKYDPEKKEYTYSSLPESMVRLISAKDAGLADYEFENDKRYLSYLRLQEEPVFPQEYEKAFFKDSDGNRFGTKEGEEDSLEKDIQAVNTTLLQVRGASIWLDGQTYYYADIEHFGTNPESGKYGVVRNHIYDIHITDVRNLGTPVLDPTEVIVTQKTKDMLLESRIDILSWRVVDMGDISIIW